MSPDRAADPWDFAERHHAPWLVWATLTATGLGCALAVRALSRTGALAGRKPAAAVAT
ncbi:MULTISPECIES: hypothetical protein [unclassified Streptomyces]|uniref:hypothetical protein n=1 Tax=unclassified Streptomyces TaxID=2593676 RepID=UPI0015E18BBA|nr:MULTISPECIES: hypothetical protein [unclassified Streptomyces]